jgi:hypothetical protein
MTRYSRWWLVMWAGDVAALTGLLLATVTPAVWLSAAFVLFGVPEAIGLRRAGDCLPPLTLAIRRYVPRWAVNPAMGSLGAWAGIVWSSRPHHRLILVLIAGVTFWGIEHFDVTFESPAE